jgi:ubiquinol-cytochrome c reductase iron-sulfur subunit
MNSGTGELSMSDATVDENDAGDASRRDFLYIATGAVGVVGIGAAVWPFIDQMNPSADVLALASIEVDLSAIEAGQAIKVSWRGQPVFIRHRTDEEIEVARAVLLDDLPDPEADSDRVKPGKDQWLVMIGVCTHFGCIPLGERGDFNGWLCPCHGSHYDTSGRIRKGPAPLNLEIPPYEFTGDDLIQIG